MEQNPYDAYLKVPDWEHRVVAEARVCERGFAHVHPTLAMLGDRIFGAWSKAAEQGGRTTPQVMVVEFTFEPPS